ncbi:MAG: pirin family protein [Spirochaetaceae bacterium]|nr:MAG: pirin family protein [Spirochaetaceae bacterium]
MQNTSSYPSPIQRIIQPRAVDLGGFVVRRSLPAAGYHSVGPWVFFDHIGPAAFSPGRGVDVIPHPHINLATVTYLFEGEIVHRDSIGSVQTITPGAINLMVAARGIVHSERSGPELRAKGHRLNGLQLWFALPESDEEIEPSFDHYPAGDLPRASIDGVGLRVMIGSAYGLRSPVKTFSPTLYAEADMPQEGGLVLPTEVEQRAVYLVSGALSVHDFELREHSLIAFEPGSEVRLSAREDSRLTLIGGTPLGRRYMWWNFVSSRKERIEQAKADWKEGRFRMVPGETEFYPLPQRDAFSEKNG